MHDLKRVIQVFLITDGQCFSTDRDASRFVTGYDIFDYDV